MKRILSFLFVVVACLQAQAATFIHTCDCNAGTQYGILMPGCVAGNDTTGDGTAANPYQTISKAKSVATTGYSVAAAGSEVRFCRGGRWPESTQAGVQGMTNFSNANFTKASPGKLIDYVPSWMLASYSNSGATVSYTATSMTDTAASWNTSENGGLGHWRGMCLRVDTNNKYQQHRQYVKIASNTANTLTFQTGPNAYSILNHTLISPTPDVGTSYTIEGCLPEWWSTHPTTDLFSLNPGTLNHREGYWIENMSFNGHQDGAVISSVAGSGSGPNSYIATITTSTAHGLTNGDLVALIDTKCSGCTDGVDAFLTNGQAVTVLNSTQFTIKCGSTGATNCAGGTGTGDPTMYYRKEALRLTLIDRDQDWITLRNVTYDGASSGIQSNGAIRSTTYTPGGSTDGIQEHLDITYSRFLNGAGLPALLANSDLYLAYNLFRNCGTTIFDHCLYLGGAALRVQPATVSTVTGDGTTTTVVLSAASNMDSTGTEPMAVTMASWATCSTSGSANVTNADVTYIDSTHFTYPSTCNGTSTGGTIDLARNLKASQQIVYRNTMVDGSVGGTGKCKGTIFVIHGNHDGLFILDNEVYNTGTITYGQCWGIAPSDGPYTGSVEVKENLRNVWVLGNRVGNTAQPVTMDICTKGCKVIGNMLTVASGTTGQQGIRAPAKDYSTPQTPSRNDKLDVMYNTVYFPSPDANSTGIEVSRDGTGHRVVGNVVLFGSGWTTGSAFFCTDCANSGTTHTNALAPSAFTVFDGNFGYASGQTSGTKPKWNSGTMNGGALGNVVRDTLAKMQDLGFDAHSGDSCNPTFMNGTPSVSTHFDLSIDTGSCLDGQGHPTIKPDLSMFMRRRSTTHPGAYDPHAPAARMPGPIHGVTVTTP